MPHFWLFLAGAFVCPWLYFLLIKDFKKSVGTNIDTPNYSGTVEFVLSKPISEYKKASDIVDFQWLNNDTRRESPDCLWRDRMRVREIQKQLASPARGSCSKRLTPPLFPGCACYLVPIRKKEIGQIRREERDEKEMWAEHDRWLNEKSKQAK